MSARQRSTRPEAARSLALSAAFLLAACASVAAQPTVDPWTPERAAAVVRIEVPKDGAPLVGSGFVDSSNFKIGSGFIVKAEDGRFFVMTSTHVVFPDYDPSAQPPADCGPLLTGTRLIQSNSGGFDLKASCVFQLQNELSLIWLSPPDDRYPYPSLEVVARVMKENDRVVVAGFPSGGTRKTSGGNVGRITSPTDLIETDASTAEGMSGGAYLAPDGVVVGVHQAGARDGARFAYMTSIQRNTDKLQPKLGAISTVAGAHSGRSDAIAETVRQCVRSKLQQLRSERERFKFSGQVDCGPDKSRNNQFVTFDASVEKPGFAIDGFVSHRDNVRNGWVGMLRYLRTEGPDTIAVAVPVQCDVSGLAAGEKGWAVTELTGYLRVIENDKVRGEIERACKVGVQ
jgi:trypsin-like peptidase